MAKTYNSIPTVSTGDVYTATAHNNIVTNVNNYRVPAMCSVYRSAALSHTSTSNYQSISWDTEVFTQTDTGMWSSGTNPSRINLTTAGVYMVGGCFTFGNTTALVAGRIDRSGGVWSYLTARTGNSTVNYVSGSALVVSDGTHYVELLAYQASGGNLAYSVNQSQMNFWATWLGQVS